MTVGVLSRPAHTVTGSVAAEGEGEVLPGVWVAGQAAGASGYLGSLSSGWRIGQAMADALLAGKAGI